MVTSTQFQSPAENKELPLSQCQSQRGEPVWPRSGQVRFPPVVQIPTCGPINGGHEDTVTQYKNGCCTTSMRKDSLKEEGNNELA